MPFDPGEAVEHLVYWLERSRVFASLRPALADSLRSRARPAPSDAASDSARGVRFVLDLGLRLQFDRTWEQAVPTLPIRTARTLARKAIEVYEESPAVALAETFDDLLGELARHRPQAFAGLHRRFAAFPSTWRVERGAVYHGADADCRDHLIQLVPTTDDLDGLLKALGRIGDAKVAEAFHRWDRMPVVWRNRIHVKPSAYAEEAGWEVTMTGKRRDLHVPAGYALVAAKPGEQPRGRGRTLMACEPSDVPCETCRVPMQQLLDLDARKPPFAGHGFRMRRFRILACAGCWATRFTRWNVDCTPNTTVEAAVLSAEATRFDRRVYTLGRRTGPTNSWGSYLGGCPNWLQDAEFPRCPECQEAMVFLAHLDLTEIGGDGVVYGFACDHCRVTACGFQCT